ncbi:hypothetical protein CRM22_003860 [Opisthorchis felineus]|uniref:Alpha-1,3-glucosyltransferase n=1 Tax=Opisthorchis felineus TaxID=147828 RepID=A0A4S2M5B5_OPIFE|nr:hypothetical protein CRM22_003860 [Opisthorchis felineus]TGZ69218.1 hypothetical protein CRM22_003860 [Opisthorchis felineus]
MLLLLLLLFVASAFKLLFTFSYHSTDFEVHRNWLAITHSLPFSRWYFESTSKWTLDYPPLFAWFEWLLSQVAAKVDPKMCLISNIAYSSPKTVWFQRCSVLLTELTVYFGLWRTSTILSRSGNSMMKRRFILTLGLLAFNYGLVIVDHIHFQYNGFLFGVLLLSVSFLIEECYVKTAVCFTVLLNLKHLFLYVAPVYFVHLLFNYCLARENRSFLSFIGKFSKLGAAVTVTVLISFLPFLSVTQLSAIYSRLFPFGRGLTHAYWAPNFWALYNGAEKVLCASNSHFGLWPHLNTSSSSMTRGLVESAEHVVLPSIRPVHTAVLVIGSMLPPLLRCAAKSSAFNDVHVSVHYREFLTALTGAAWASFLFGWHVHEKAVIVFLLPLNLLAMAVPNFRSIAFYATTIGHYSLMPLIPTKAETPAILFMFLSYTTIHWLALFRLHPASAKTDVYQTNGPLGRLVSIHLWGLVPLYMVSFILWPLLRMSSGLPFLPLMATSMYTAIGLCLGYVYFLWLSWQSDEASAVEVTKIERTHQVKEREVKGRQERVQKKADEKQQTAKRKLGEKPPAMEGTLGGRQEKFVPQKSNKKKAKKLKDH